jgi:membrane protein DedA with SNARE-associated domain
MTYAIVHFEIPADDVARAQKFYKQAFGWKISDPWKMTGLFERWGAPSLPVAKFVPGFSTVAPPIAGALRLGLPAFLLK